VINNTWGGSAAPRSVFANDTGVDGNVLNAGTYVLDNVVVKPGDAAYEGSATSRFGGASAAVSEFFSLPDGSRFEMRIPNMSITVETDGSVHYQVSPASLQLYDTLSQEYYDFDVSTASAALREIAARAGMSEQELRDELRYTFEYQTRDSATGEVVSGNLVLDFGNAYINSSQYYGSGYTLQQGISSARLNSAFDNNSQDGSPEVATQTLGMGSYFAVDLSGDTLTIRYATYDGAGNTTWQAFTSKSIREYAEMYGTTLSGTTIQASAAMAQAMSDEIGPIPVYAWIHADGRVQPADPADKTGWTCVQVGTTTWPRPMSVP
jgi:hypothetical protein